MTGVLTGKGLTYGGSLARTEATGYGLCYFTQEMLADKRQELRRARRSSSPAPATWPSTPPRRRRSWARKVVAMSDSNGYIYDPERHRPGGRSSEIKEVERGRIKEYVQAASRRHLHRGLQRHLDDPLRYRAALRHPERAGRRRRQDAGRTTAAWRWPRARTCPPRLEAIEVFQDSGVLFAPGKAANAGGVATSALEMSQNSQRLSWTFEEVDEKLERHHGGHLPQRLRAPPKNTALRVTSLRVRTSPASRRLRTRCSLRALCNLPRVD